MTQNGRLQVRYIATIYRNFNLSEQKNISYAGRKQKAPEEKAVMVSFSCSKAQKKRIVELAGEKEVGISEYLRTVLFGE